MDRARELNEAIDEILADSNENEEFNRRLKRLITNAMEDSYMDDDILAIIYLMEKEA